MPDELNLDKLKLKTSGQLTDTEKDFVRQNVDKLNDEDKSAYADFLQVQETPIEENQPGEQDAAGSETPPEGGNGGETAKPPVTPSFSFKSEEEAREFVRKQTEENERAKQAAIDKATTPEQKKYVEENWKPKDWDEGIRKTVEIAKKEIREEMEEARQKEIGVKLQKEWEDLAKEKKIPALTTKEGKTIHDNIVKYGVAAGKQTFKEAYSVWERIPKEFGGGLEPGAKPPVDPSEAAKVLAAQKKAASKIGGQNTGTKPGDSGLKVSYADLHKARSTEELLKKAGVM